MEILPQVDVLKRPRLTISMSSSSTPNVFGLMVAFAEPAFLERDHLLRVQAATWVREGIGFSVDENELVVSRVLCKQYSPVPFFRHS
jgi:hypothetical protein